MDLLEYLARTVRMLSAQVDHMTFLQADQRIAQLLLNLAAAQERHTVHCTHEELAGLAGASRVTAVSYTHLDVSKRQPVTSATETSYVGGFTRSPHASKVYREYPKEVLRDTPCMRR